MNRKCQAMEDLINNSFTNASQCIAEYMARPDIAQYDSAMQNLHTAYTLLHINDYYETHGSDMFLTDLNKLIGYMSLKPALVKQQLTPLTQVLKNLGTDYSQIGYQEELRRTINEIEY